MGEANGEREEKKNSFMEGIIYSNKMYFSQSASNYFCSWWCGVDVGVPAGGGGGGG